MERAIFTEKPQNALYSKPKKGFNLFGFNFYRPQASVNFTRQNVTDFENELIFLILAKYSKTSVASLYNHGVTPDDINQ